MAEKRGKQPEHAAATFDSLLTPAGGRTGQLWSLLPRELSALFRPQVLDVSDEVLREIQSSVPEYARPLEGAFGRTITAGVQQGILQFVDRLGDPSLPDDDRKQVFAQLGRHELGQGRNLDLLHTAYRVGARVTWRRMSEVGTAAGLSVSTLCLLAEAIFAYLDELSALSVEGHAAAQAREAGTVERRRRRLLDIILAVPPAPAPVIAKLAAAAEWVVPEQVMAVALEVPEAAGDLPPLDVGAEFLADLEGAAPILLLPDPDEETRRTLEKAARGRRIAVGPQVVLTEAAQSLRWARQALTLVRVGALPDAPVTWCEEHLSDLWLFSDPFLIKQLAKQILAPLAGLTPKQYTKLAETLLAWLETRGNVKDVARRLSIHPQTVRARMQEVETLFEQRLQDPQQRFELVLALRASRVTSW